MFSTFAQTAGRRRPKRLAQRRNAGRGFSYTKLTHELEAASRSAGLDVPNKQDPHAMNRLQRLQDAGPQFDLTYLAEQQSWHKKLIASYSMEERAGRNEALKKHAAQGRAVLIKNLEEIERLQARLKDERTTPGR